MNSIYKVTVRKHSAVRHEQLQQQLNRWMITHTHLELLQKKVLFKATSNQIEKVEKIINQQIVHYLVLRVLEWLVIDLSPSQLLGLNNNIKVSYRTLMIQEYFRHSNIFELFIITHIKLTVCFIEEHFDSILIDTALECQLCIILYYTILGVQVNEKTYHLLLNRYMIKNQKIMKQTLSSHTSFGQDYYPKRSIVSVQAKSKKNMASKKIIESQKQKSYKYMRMSKMSFYGNYESRPQKGDNIETILKENLKVEPLPKLKKKKVNLEEYKRIVTEPIGQRISEEKSQELSPAKHKSKCLFSNQLSTSLKTQYPDQLIFQLNSKKVRLNQTTQNFERENNLFRFSQHKNKQNLTFYGQNLQTEPPKKVQTQDWCTVVTDLKQKVYNLKWKETEDIPKTKQKKIEDNKERLTKKKILSKMSFYNVRDE